MKNCRWKTTEDKYEKDNPEHKKEYGRNYYWMNREEILEKKKEKVKE